MSRDHWYPFEGAKWRDGTRGLSPGGKGVYKDMITLLQESPDAGYLADARRIAADLGYRDYRTVAGPLEELVEAHKLIEVGGRFYNPRVCRDRHARAVKKKARSPVPAAVWEAIKKLEEPPPDPKPSPELAPAPVDEAVGGVGANSRERPQSAGCRADDRPMIENSGAQVFEIPRSANRQSESEQKSEVVVVTGTRCPRAREGPPWAHEARQDGAMAMACG
jgi:hypothetical protein